MSINLGLSDSPESIHITSNGETLECVALCNPQCQFSWTYINSTEILSRGKFLKIPTSHQGVSVSCVVDNSIGTSTAKFDFVTSVPEGSK